MPAIDRRSAPVTAAARWPVRRRRSWRAGTAPGTHRSARQAAAWAALACAAAASPALAGCSNPASHPAAPAATASQASESAGGTSPPGASPGPADPQTAAALLRIAQAFNNAYDNGDFGAAYDRWDTRSRAIISRAEYIRRHRVCAPATHSKALVTGATRAGGGAWHVQYEIGGQQLTDTWFYAGHRWGFDILLSNPDSARLYRLPFAKYAAAIGCKPH